MIPEEHFEKIPFLRNLVSDLEEELGKATKSSIQAMVREFGRDSVWRAHDKVSIGEGPSLERMMKELKRQRLNQQRAVV